MKIISQTTLRNFKAWSGAEDTLKTILDSGQDEQFDLMIEELFPDGLTETELNDMLWFDSEWVFQQLGINNQ